MAFLDNSGDIILDAVLTDTGRLRLAQGNGSFKITQFAFGDDEINYGLYDKNHPSGSAYYDLDILQTPVFEAFTNNASSMKFQLITNNNAQLLYLPVMKLNTNLSSLNSNTNSYIVASSTAWPNFSGSVSTAAGVINGTNPGGTSATLVIIDQGLDSSETSKTETVSDYDPTLSEDLFLVEINNNFVSLVDSTGTDVSLSFVDDDGIATYSIAFEEPSNLTRQLKADTSSTTEETTPLNGSRDKRLNFSLKLKSDLNVNNSLYERFGGTTTIGGNTYYYIDTFVTVKGVTVGTQLTIPVKIIKA